MTPRATALIAAAITAGWILLTWGIAAVTTPWAWAISGGLFLLSAVGWRLVVLIALNGLFALSRGSPDA